MDNGFLLYFKRNKKIFVALILILLGIALIFASSFEGDTKESGNNKETGLDEYKKKVEEQISSLCSAVEGVGKCRVFITFERGEQKVYKGTTLTEELPPRVLGVSVVCQGADRDSVKSELTEMLVALFNIGSNRVAILKLNS